MIGRPIDGKYMPVIQKSGRWYVGWVEEVPGVHAQERTLAEVKRSLKEALRDILEINCEIAREKGRVSRR